MSPTKKYSSLRKKLGIAIMTGAVALSGYQLFSTISIKAPEEVIQMNVLEQKIHTTLKKTNLNNLEYNLNLLNQQRIQRDSIKTSENYLKASQYYQSKKMGIESFYPLGILMVGASLMVRRRK